MKNSDVSNICQLHNKQALFFNHNCFEIQNKYPCVECCQDYIFQKTRIDNSQKEKLKEKTIINLKFLNIIERSIQFYELNLLNQIKAIKQEIQFAYQNFESSNKIITEFDSIDREEKEKIVCCTFLMQQNIERELKQLVNVSKVDNLAALLKENKIQQKLGKLKNQKIKTRQVNFQTKEITISAFTEIQHNNICNAIAFNYKSTELVAGYSNFIQVYKKSINEEFNLTQKLKFHNKNVSYLQFMKNDTSFISGGQDGKVVIWEYDENKCQYTQACIFNEHNYSVTCIKLDQSQNILVSSGVDCTVRFYKYKTNDWATLKTIETSSFVTDLSFNKSYSQLFCWQINKIILIIQGSSYNWKIIQQINTQHNGIQICSFGQKYFAVFDYKTSFLQIYGQQSLSQYKKNSELELKTGKQLTSFHMRNIQKESLLFIQYGQTLALVSCQEGLTKIQYIMDLQDTPHYGRMSEDRNYFAYWVSSENLIKIIELKEI